MRYSDWIFARKIVQMEDENWFLNEKEYKYNIYVQICFIYKNKMKIRKWKYKLYIVGLYNTLDKTL